MLIFLEVGSEPPEDGAESADAVGEDITCADAP